MVVTVGTRPITLAEVEQTVALSLHQLEEQQTKLLRESIQHLIEEELLAAEAARVGVMAKLAGFPGPIRLTGRSSPFPLFLRKCREFDRRFWFSYAERQRFT